MCGVVAEWNGVGTCFKQDDVFLLLETVHLCHSASLPPPLLIISAKKLFQLLVLSLQSDGPWCPHCRTGFPYVGNKTEALETIHATDAGFDRMYVKSCIHDWVLDISTASSLSYFQHRFNISYGALPCETHLPTQSFFTAVATMTSIFLSHWSGTQPCPLPS